MKMLYYLGLSKNWTHGYEKGAYIKKKKLILLGTHILQ
jgi:hypothetical protein